jgi:uncharacterized membrane protein YtjA (UPF0391 family)
LRGEQFNPAWNNWVGLTLLRLCGCCAVLKNTEDRHAGLGRYLSIVALVAALLGFGGIAGVAVEAAKIVFFVAIVLFAISVVAGLVRGRTVL